MPDPNNLPTCECFPGATPNLGEKLDNIYCLLLAIVNGGGVGAGAQSVANQAARSAAVPDYLGQLLYQQDTSSFFFATALTAGSWSGQFAFGADAVQGSLTLNEGATGLNVTILPVGLTAQHAIIIPDTDGTFDVTP